jgi:hypothetical protein
MIRSFMAATLLAMACACTPPAAKTEPEAAAPAAAPAPAPAPAPKFAGDPLSVVNEIYAPYLVANGAVGPSTDGAPWSDDLKTLFGQVNQSPDEVYFDYDPIIAAQDWQLTDFTAKADAPPADGKAAVTVTFKNAGRPETIHYALVQVNGAWRVDNLVSTGGGDLRADLAKAIGEEKAATEKKKPK